MSTAIDFGPGESHVFKRINGEKCFYLPELFHLAPTVLCSNPIQVFVNDIHRCKTIVQVYGAIGYERHRQNYIIINNYPIRLIEVFGRLVSCSTRSKIAHTKTTGKVTTTTRSKTQYICRIDDSSGRNLIINCIVDEDVFMDFDIESTFFGARASPLLQFVGKVHLSFLREKEVYVERVKLLCHKGKDQFGVELRLWGKYLQQRRALQRPWVYTPPDNRIWVTVDESSSEEEFSDVDIQDYNYINVKTFDEIVCEFISWILSNDKVKFNLKDIYHDPTLSKIIDNQTVHDPCKPSRGEVFHSIRHHIQVDCKLILITKSQNVYCTDLFKVAKLVSEELEDARVNKTPVEIGVVQLKILKILNDCSPLNIMYVNEVVLWLVKYEESLWKYDDEREEWKYHHETVPSVLQDQLKASVVVEEETTLVQDIQDTYEDDTHSVLIEDSIIILD